MIPSFITQAAPIVAGCERSWCVLPETGRTRTRHFTWPNNALPVDWPGQGLPTSGPQTGGHRIAASAHPTLGVNNSGRFAFAPLQRSASHADAQHARVLRASPETLVRGAEFDYLKTESSPFS
jgi:hypothetical protein